MPMDPVTLPNAAGIPPHVAQVPIAMTAAAPGASRRTHAAAGGRASRRGPPVERPALRPRPAPGRDDGRPGLLADARDVADLRDRLPGWGDHHWMPPLGGQPALGAADPARAAIESASAAIATTAGLVGSWSTRARPRRSASATRSSYGTMPRISRSWLSA